MKVTVEVKSLPELKRELDRLSGVVQGKLCRNAAGVHPHQYASEMAWREDNRRKPNGTLFQ